MIQQKLPPVERLRAMCLMGPNFSAKCAANMLIRLPWQPKSLGFVTFPYLRSIPKIKIIGKKLQPVERLRGSVYGRGRGRGVTVVKPKYPPNFVRGIQLLGKYSNECKSVLPWLQQDSTWQNNMCVIKIETHKETWWK